jgi:hypothetical protein
MPYTIIRTLKNCIRFEVVPHPLHSSDLATTDIRMFAALKKHVQETHFTCHGKVQVVVGKMVLRTA